MARKSWSYVLFGAGLVNLVLAAYLPAPIRWLNLLVLSCCLVGGMLIRRTMIGKVERVWSWSEEGSQTGDWR